jgi:hypothetical protein
VSEAPSPERWSFDEAVSRELRSFWRSRGRLWLLPLPVLAVLGVVWSDHAASVFLALCALHLLGSTWLASDLLSVEPAKAAVPERGPTSDEFLARTLGRLGPLYLAVGIVVLALVTWWSITQPENLFSPLGSFFRPGTNAHWYDTLLDLLTQWWGLFWVAALVITAGLPYAGVAALLSALARRPRRLPAAGFTFIVCPTLLLQVVEPLANYGPMLSRPWEFLSSGWGPSGPIDAALLLVTWPILLMQERLSDDYLQTYRNPVHSGSGYILATLTFLCFGLALFVGVWCIAAVRSKAAKG